VCWFLHQEQTIHPISRKFYEKEVFKSNQFEDNAIDKVIGKCYVLFIKDYVKGKPPGAKPKDVWICESRYHDKQMHKIKNWNTCLPEAIRQEEVKLEMYPVPLSLKKVPSVFLKDDEPRDSPVSAKDSEKLSTKRFKAMSSHSKVSKEIPSRIIV
jgi:chromatin structure-remodeling complex subunit RSC1/2